MYHCVEQNVDNGVIIHVWGQGINGNSVLFGKKKDFIFK